MNTLPVDFPIPDQGTAELCEAVRGMLRTLDRLPKDYRVNKALVQFEKIAMALEESPK